MPSRFLQKQRARYGQFGVASVLFGVLLFGGLYLADVGKRLQRNMELDHTAQRFLIAMLDGETAVRGYAITGNEAFLEPYHTSFT